MKKSGLMFLLFVICILLASCSRNSENKGYTITWKNTDEEILEVDTNVTHGTIPSFDGNTPTMESDGQFEYVFSGWTPILEEASEDKVYYATFKKIYLHTKYDGSYVLSHITTERISTGVKETYKLGNIYFGVRLVEENIEAQISSGIGNMSFNFGEKYEHSITYKVFEEKIVMYCEEGIDLFGKGNYQKEFDILIEVVDDNTYFILQASNGTYNFSYYLVANA